MTNCVCAENSNSLDSKKSFVVGFNSEFPPFGYQADNGEYTGFDIELAKEVCERNNWTFIPQPITNWGTKNTELNSGMMDCIWSEFTINGREDEYTWSKAYFNNTQVVVVKADSNISSQKDLKDKDVEIQEGHSALNVLEKEKRSLMNSFKSLTKIKEYNTGFMDLESGVCDAIIVDVPLAKYHIKEKSADKFKILDEPIAFEQYGIAFKKGNDDLKNQVQKTLDEMYSDGTVNKIAQKYNAYEIEDSLLYP
nr:amino acid ABC transporter substrate-binding protein [Methanosphaera sp. ISO3-F5]